MLIEFYMLTVYPCSGEAGSKERESALQHSTQAQVEGCLCHGEAEHRHETSIETHLNCCPVPF